MCVCARACGVCVCACVCVCVCVFVWRVCVCVCVRAWRACGVGLPDVVRGNSHTLDPKPKPKPKPTHPKSDPRTLHKRTYREAIANSLQAPELGAVERRGVGGQGDRG